MTRTLGVFLTCAALINAVPSLAAFHPFTHAEMSSDDDIAGLQDETAVDRTSVRAAIRNRPPGPGKSQGPGIAEQWRQMAEQARRLAKSMPDKAAQRKLLDLAEGYDRLAKDAKKG